MLKPCIRGLKTFKKGCPSRTWENGGCPAWIELHIAQRNDPLKKETKGNCIDLWQIELKLNELGLLEGNQRAIESFRNNMTTEGSPRPDPAVTVLIKKIDEYQRAKLLAYADRD